MSLDCASTILSHPAIKVVDDKLLFQSIQTIDSLGVKVVDRDSMRNRILKTKNTNWKRSRVGKDQGCDLSLSTYLPVLSHAQARSNAPSTRTMPICDPINRNVYFLAAEKVASMASRCPCLRWQHLLHRWHFPSLAWWPPCRSFAWIRQQCCPR